MFHGKDIQKNNLNFPCRKTPVLVPNNHAHDNSTSTKTGIEKYKQNECLMPNKAKCENFHTHHLSSACSFYCNF